MIQHERQMLLFAPLLCSVRFAMPPANLPPATML
jgi:hypothetical protein